MKRKSRGYLHAEYGMGETIRTCDEYVRIAAAAVFVPSVGAWVAHSLSLSMFFGFRIKCRSRNAPKKI